MPIRSTGEYKIPDLTEGVSNPRFVYDALARYPTGARAIEALRKIRRPQVGDAAVDKSNPGEDTETFLSISTCLGVKMKGKKPESPPSLLKDNWKDLFGPWVIYILDQLILSGDEPYTPTGVDLYDRALWSVCYFLSSFLGHEHDFRKCGQMSPRLFPLLSQVWFKVIDENHFTWGRWSKLLLGFIQGSVAMKSDFRKDWDVFAKSGPLGSVFIRHIHREALHMPTASDFNISDLNIFLFLLIPIFHPGQTLPFKGKEEKYALLALVRLLSALLYKRRLLRNASTIGSELMAVLHALNFITLIADSNLRVAEVIEAGLIISILKAYPCYYSRAHELELTGQRFDAVSSKILEHMAQYMAFPNVLHQFLRYAKTIGRFPEYERNLEKNSKALYDVWVRIRDQAYVWRSVRRRMISRGAYWKCTNALCDGSYARPGSDINGADNKIKFYCCAHCSGVTYCSRACQKAHWRAEHREVCKELRQQREDGVASHSRTDQQFFRGITQQYLDSQFELIHKAISDYRMHLASWSQKNNYTLSSEHQLILNKRRNPIFVADLARKDFKQIDNGVVVNSEDFITRSQDRVERSRLVQLAESYRRRNMDVRILYVVFMVPLRGGKSWAYGSPFEFKHTT
ncbi:hypothetical protein L218DRAFT_961037 [Marasmius fiardii PR-910]|nr:hypothetical protein L218DRAFT_961037 [Marasmius fiardii PR-910]